MKLLRKIKFKHVLILLGTLLYIFISLVLWGVVSLIQYLFEVI